MDAQTEINFQNPAKPELPEVIIYTDGACSGNPGSGGYGVVLIAGDKRRELYGGFRLTTNNRMEMTAAIEGLKAIKRECKVTLYSDSKYLVDSVIKGWVYNWEKKGWMRTKTERALNVDLWKELLIMLKKHKVTLKWVKGHADNVENQIADRLAVKGSTEAKNSSLIDAGFEAQNRF
jgi:ribonuclease HI